MIGNVMDRRHNPACPEVDAVFEPSFHDNAQRPDGSEFFPDCSRAPGCFTVTSTYNTTVGEAMRRAETEWSFPVTVYLYDLGMRPLG